MNIIEAFPGQGDGARSIEQSFSSSLENHKRLLSYHSTFEPNFLFGYSFGIYPALVVAGVLSEGDALELAKIRESFVLESEAQSDRKTAMLSCFGICRDRAESLSRKYHVFLSNDNGPNLQVLSGYKDNLEKVEATAPGWGIRKTCWLPIEGAYHVPLREKESRIYKDILEDYEFQDPQIPLISSTKPRMLCCVPKIKEELYMQMIRPVKLPKAVVLMRDQNIDLLFDIGPEGAIKKMVKKIDENLLSVALDDPYNRQKWNDLFPPAAWFAKKL